MSNIQIISIIIAFIFLALSITFVTMWVYKDAKQRGHPAGMWALLVVISGNFIGLILYLLIVRKQKNVICVHCGSTTNIQGSYCSNCGKEIEMEAVTIQEKKYKKNNGLLFASIGCIILIFVTIGIFMFSTFNSPGFISNRQSSSYTGRGTNTFARDVRQNSSGDIWNLSFSEATAGFSFSNTYNATSKPQTISIDARGTGSIQLIVTQGKVSITETIEEGIFIFDMSAFDTGRISLQIICIDNVSNFTGRIDLVTN
jgi:predicted nucleic acid-binding Zn ribbon protein